MTRSIVLLSLLVLLLGCSTTSKRADSVNSADQETVVLIHGLAGSPWTLSTLESALEDDGYRTLSFAYSAKDESLRSISSRFQDFVKDSVKTRRYHLVGFSLGNIVIRASMKDGLRSGLGRAVMIAPPNRSVGLARQFKDCCIYSWIAGEAGQKLADKSFYESLPTPTVEFGVIAGDCGTCLSYDKANDGIVPVEATKLAGMKDWVVIRASHPGLRRHDLTVKHCRSFLKSGEFARE